MSTYGAGLFGAGLYGGYDIPGVPFLPADLGASGRIVVEVAFGADRAADPATWTWRDVTRDVRADPGLSWRLGRADESSRSNPASLTVQLDNSDSAYSLDGRSVNWPNVRRGVPVRVRVDPGDGGGWRTAYLGFADGWTPTWAGERGNVAAVSLSASGTLRRLGQGAPPVVSPLRRAMTSTASVVGYWPMEDGKRSTVLAPAVGISAMTFTGEPKLADDGDSFACTTPIPRTDGASFDALVDDYTPSAAAQVRFLLAVPDGGLTDGALLATIHTSGTTGRWDLAYSTGGGGAMRLHVYDAAGFFITTVGFANYNLNGFPRRISVEMTQTGADILWRVNTTTATDTGGSGGSFGTISGRTFGAVRRVQLCPDADISGATVGHLTVQRAVTSLYEANGPLLGFDGETTTGQRLPRLCAENGVPLDLYGGTVDSSTRGDQMGPQPIDALLTLLQECEDSEQGQLWDGRTTGLAYTTRRRQENATPVLTINAGAGELAPPFDAVDDDQRARNRASVTRRDGATSTFEDLDGPLGVNAIGAYEDSVTINAFSDASTLDVAGWLVARGTVPGYRYPGVTLNLRSTPQHAAAALDLVPGARVDVTNLRDALTGMTGATVSLIVEGIEHDVTPTSWVVRASCSPFAPWRIVTTPAEVGDTSEWAFRVGNDSAVLASAVSAGATSVSVTTTSGPRWTTVADDYPLQLDVGGVVVTATACSGAGATQTFTTAPFPVSRAAGSPVQLAAQPALGL